MTDEEKRVADAILLLAMAFAENTNRREGDYDLADQMRDMRESHTRRVIKDAQVED